MTKYINTITYYLLVLLVDFEPGVPLVEFACTILSTELEGFVSLSGGSLRFSTNN